MRYLDEELTEYSKEEKYPFHMPGHKRKDMLTNDGDDDTWQRICDLDITEIDGFDDLHDPSGMILDIEKGYADIYGADKAHLLVNGSTCGILSAISAVLSGEDTVIASRLSHKSFYHAAAIKDLNVRYVYPKESVNGTLYRDITSGLIKAIKEQPEAKAVYVTSPTYEGYMADIRAIAAKAHESGMLLIVDEAHGAHLGPLSNDADPAIKQGADIVITSLHKMLPSLTQTALILERGLDPAVSHKIEYYLDHFETSSPSYILMASAARCLRFLRTGSKKEFERYKALLDDFYRKIAGLKNLHVSDEPDHDRSHILISKADGLWLAKELRIRYDIEVEMAGADHILALSTVSDTDKMLDRLSDALFELDEKAMYHLPKPGLDYQKIRPERVLSIHEAQRSTEAVPLTEAAGRVASEEVMLYPPGVPLIAPGERISAELKDCLIGSIEAGMTVRGIHNGLVYVSKGV